MFFFNWAVQQMEVGFFFAFFLCVCSTRFYKMECLVNALTPFLCYGFGVPLQNSANSWIPRRIRRGSSDYFKGYFLCMYPYWKRAFQNNSLAFYILIVKNNILRVPISVYISDMNAVMGLLSWKPAKIGMVLGVVPLGSFALPGEQWKETEWCFKWGRRREHR